MDIIMLCKRWAIWIHQLWEQNFVQRIIWSDLMVATISKADKQRKGQIGKGKDSRILFVKCLN